MLFNSFNFVALVLITLALYYTPALRRWQVPILIASSFTFYAANLPVLLLLLIFSIAINIGTSYVVMHGNPAKRKAYATFGVVLNLAVLAFFKYAFLFGGMFFSAESTVGQFLLSIPLPVGISFFTFQGISLVVDTYKSKDVEEYKSLVPKSMLQHSFNTSFFISFFPQLVAGPIVKAHDFIPQIKPKFFKEINWEVAFRIIVLGFFLKMVVADNMKDHTFWISFPEFQARSTMTLLIMLFGYSMQIFADFAGYSLIAIGLARLFGYVLFDNFNFPYISRTFSEFWRRWHISLSTFLKEYLYIAMGGNRKGDLRTYLNLMITMFLGGLWHGAAWSYAIWGSFHGIALAVERFSSKYIKVPRNAFWDTLRILMVFTFITLAWLLFKLPEFSHVVEFFNSLFNNTERKTGFKIIVFVLLYSIPVVLYHVYYLYWNKKGEGENKLAWIEPYLYGGMLFFIITNAGSAQEFIYFQF
ncbi:MAG: MBOAT family O-acyltransferase [Bacteroidota bacterium]